MWRPVKYLWITHYFLFSGVHLHKWSQFLTKSGIFGFFCHFVYFLASVYKLIFTCRVAPSQIVPISDKIWYFWRFLPFWLVFGNFLHSIFLFQGFNFTKSSSSSGLNSTASPNRDHSYIRTFPGPLWRFKTWTESFGSCSCSARSWGKQCQQCFQRTEQSCPFW